MKYFFVVLAGTLILPASVSASGVGCDQSVSTVNDAEVRTSFSASANTGGNSGGSVTTGDASASMHIVTRANDDYVACDTTVTSTGTASGWAMVTIDSVNCVSIFTSVASASSSGRHLSSLARPGLR